MATNKSFNKSSANKSAPSKNAKLKKRAAIGGGILVLLIISLAFFPNYGTIKYGICKTYVEMQEPYPGSIQFINAEEELTYTNSVTISYKKIDPFGLEAMNEIQCFFKDDEQGNITISKIDINGKKREYPQEDPELIKKFNVGIPAIIQNPPSLVMPFIMSTDIKSYR